VDPPSSLPAWLPFLSPPGTRTALPARLVLSPGASVALPIALETASLPPGGLTYAGQPLLPADQTSEYTAFFVPLTAPSASGEYARLLPLRNGPGRRAAGRALRLNFAVRDPAHTAADGIVLISPTFVRPANGSSLAVPPNLCWSEPASAGPAPLLFRVRAVGPASADSGWISATCWQTPALPPGSYAWKVFVRDGQGFMNRTNQRPFVFSLR
jgi:hypothetical protein